jgi:hypothetical protein
MQTFQGPEDDKITGAALARLASVAAELGLKDSALAYIERAYAAFDGCPATPFVMARRRSDIYLATLDGRAVEH